VASTCIAADDTVSLPDKRRSRSRVAQDSSNPSCRKPTGILLTRSVDVRPRKRRALLDPQKDGALSISPGDRSAEIAGTTPESPPVLRAARGHAAHGLDDDNGTGKRGGAPEKELVPSMSREPDTSSASLRAALDASDKAHDFARQVLGSEEDRARLSLTPWQGGYRWFRAPNVIFLEKARKGPMVFQRRMSSLKTTFRQRERAFVIPTASRSSSRTRQATIACGFTAVVKT
jgi:hypothetical protein